LVNELSPVAREQRILMTHGTQDPMVRIGEVRQQVGVLKAAGLKIDFRELQKAHTIAGEEEIKLIRDFVCAGY